MAIRSLMELGHKDVVVIGGHREESDTTRLRYEGCLRAFRERGLAFQESQYETARFTFADGYRAAKALLQRNDRFTALFAMSDVMALGAIRALTDAGKRVPQDVSVMGFDGLSIGDFTVPRLATVAQSVQQLAEEGMNLLLGCIEDGTPASHKVVPVELVLRESVQSL